jgi:KAP family P-loop domain
MTVTESDLPQNVKGQRPERKRSKRARGSVDPDGSASSSSETAVQGSFAPPSSPPISPHGNLFLLMQGKDEKKPLGETRRRADPGVRAGDVVLVVTPKGALTYAVWAVADAVHDDDGTPWVELDEEHWRELPTPISLRSLRKLPGWSEAALRLAGMSQTPESRPLDPPLSGAVLERIEEHDPGFRGWVENPPYLEDAALFGWLGRTAREALGRADGMRLALQQDRIHMEHLVFGLVDGGARHIQRLFRKHQLEGAELRGLLSRDVRIPDQYEPSRLSELPPLSRHARGALIASFSTPRYQGAHTLESRHVLYGALSVKDCSVIELLKGRGLERDEIDIVARDRVDWVIDAPAEEDLLGRKPYAEALAKRLRRIDRDPHSTKSLLIHVDGAWGAGKSTLLHFLEAELKKLEFTTLELNAWREQRIGPPWWSLMTALWRCRRDSKERRLGRLRVRVQELTDRIRVNGTLFLTAILVLASLAFVLFFLAGPDIGAAKEQAESIGSIIALVVTVLGGALAASRFLLVGSAKGASIFVRANENPMQGILKLFGLTLDRIDQPVVFFIDDLDRCSEDYVVEFLESVQTLVRDSSGQGRAHSAAERGTSTKGGPYFVIAADGAWIRTSYEKAYTTFLGIRGPARPLGSLFLDKVFQLTVQLPRITDRVKAAYLAGLLGQNAAMSEADRQKQEATLVDIRDQLESADDEVEALEAAKKASELEDPMERLKVLGEAAVRLSDEQLEARTEHVLQPFAMFLDGNPRTIRRFVNAYGVLRAQRTLEEEFVETDSLALWTVLQLQWPVLADHLREHPEHVVEFGKDPPDVPANLVEVFADDEIKAVVSDADHGGPLTPELVRACGGPPSR